MHIGVDEHRPIACRRGTDGYHNCPVLEGGTTYAEGLLGQTVVLVDGPALAGLMIDYGVGVSTRQVYEIKAVDTDFFEE